MAICKRGNSESWNRMRGMRVGMRGNRVGMMEMRGIRVGMRGIESGNERNQDENLPIRVEMMNKKMWRGIKINGNVHIYKNIVLTLWNEKQLKNLI